MLGSSIAFSQKVPELDVGELTARRLIGPVQNEHLIVLAA